MQPIENFKRLKNFKNIKTHTHTVPFIYTCMTCAWAYYKTKLIV